MPQAARPHSANGSRAPIDFLAGAAETERIGPENCTDCSAGADHGDHAHRIGQPLTRGRSVSAYHVESRESPRPEDALYRHSAPHENQHVQAQVDDSPMGNRRGQWGKDGRDQPPRERRPPLKRAGVKPRTIAASPGKAIEAISHASAVKALIATVAVAGSGPSPGSDEFDLLDFVVAVAGRRRHLDFFADLWRPISARPRGEL